jgi:hypothetical protein
MPWIANHVLDVITTPLPAEVPASNAPFGADAGENSVQSPVAAPGRALDMLEYMLRTKGPRIQEEICVNVCILFGQVARRGGVGAERSEELSKFIKEIRPLLESEAGAQADTKLKNAASKALETIA